VGLLALVPAHGTDLPHLQPMTATGFLCKTPRSPNLGVVAVVLTYADGTVLRADMQHMLGFKDAQELMKYASAAPDGHTYIVECEAEVVT